MADQQDDNAVVPGDGAPEEGAVLQQLRGVAGEGEPVPAVAVDAAADAEGERQVWQDPEEKQIEHDFLASR